MELQPRGIFTCVFSAISLASRSKMAPHRRHHGNHDKQHQDNGAVINDGNPLRLFPVTSPTVRTITTVMSLSIPPIFLILSLTFTLLSILIPTFAQQTLYYTSGGRHGAIPNITNSASPFWTCTIISGGQFELGTHNQSCTKIPLGDAGYRLCRNESMGNEHNCQQLEMARNLMLSSAVFVGLAMVTSFVVAGLGWVWYNAEKAAESGAGSTPSGTVRYALPVLARVCFLFTCLTAVLLFVGQLLGVNALVNDWRPNADFMISGTDSGDDDVGPWYMGRASSWWATMGWAWALAAVWVQGVAWRWSL
ncbi:hypothetical protein F5884DRAFT_814301 [Xylogone sp. PMI_703]|nr:hypothetical protein F5884DRAFT_814301 [Xylogone sp. PMI_703]